MGAVIAMCPENHFGDVECNGELSYRFWRWLSRLCGSENTSPGSVFVDQTRPSRKAVTFSLEWTEEIEGALCRGVDAICNSIIMGNCVVGVGPNLP